MYRKAHAAIRGGAGPGRTGERPRTSGERRRGGRPPPPRRGSPPLPVVPSGRVCARGGGGGGMGGGNITEVKTKTEWEAVIADASTTGKSVRSGPGFAGFAAPGPGPPSPRARAARRGPGQRGRAPGVERGRGRRWEDTAQAVA